MQTPLSNTIYSPLSIADAQNILTRFLGTASIDDIQELQRISNHAWSDSSIFLFARPFNPAKETLLVFTCCHGWQLLYYWAAEPTETNAMLMRRYNVVLVLNYLLAAENASPQRKAMVTDLFRAMYAKADVLVTHPADRYGALSPRDLNRELRPNRTTGREYTFHSPDFAALWPVCPYGSIHVARMLFSDNKSPEELKKLLYNDQLPCEFEERAEASLLRIKGKDSRVDCTLYDFFSTFWKSHRLMLSYNHPAYRLMAYQAERLSRAIANLSPTVPQIPLDYTLHMNDNDAYMVPVYPCYAPAHKILGLQYHPFYHQDTVYQHYAAQIDRIAARQVPI